MSERQQLSLSFIDQERTAKGLTPLLQRLPLGHLILVSQKDTEANNTAKVALLEPRDDYQEGRDDSVQRVRFADLSVLGKSETLSIQPIAIKPFGTEWLATHDYRTAKKLNENRHTTFEPVGFLRQEDEQGRSKIGVVTKFEQGVTSCDNILWGG